MIPPYMLDLASLQLWVMDSANACDEYGVNALTAMYSQQYQQLQNLEPDTPTWMMSHRPIWGFQSNNSPTLNQMLQIALAKTPAKKLPGAVQLSLAGHMHIYESLTFPQADGRPPQIVVGNSGVSLSTYPASSSFSATVDGETATGNALNKYGYLQINFEKEGFWQGNMLDTGGDALFFCDSRYPSQQKTICE